MRGDPRPRLRGARPAGPGVDAGMNVLAEHSQSARDYPLLAR